MADEFQSQRPCECNLGQITPPNREMIPNYICPCQTLIQQEYERIQANKPT